MTAANPNPSPLIVVTGANGLVGSRVCAALSERGSRVRAVVRRAGTAPVLPGIGEEVGDFTDPEFAAVVVLGADSVVSTVHPMGSDVQAQHRVGVEGTTTLAQAARDAGVSRFVHISTAAVYDRSTQAGDVDEASPLVGDDAGDYAVTKRDADAALAEVNGITRILVRPPAILGNGETSVWNTLRPATMRDEEWARHAIPEKSFAWVHVSDLADFAADVATDKIVSSDDPASGPLEGGCTPVNVAAGPATMRDYVGTVTEALGMEAMWDEGEAWTGQILADRAHGWGWTPAVGLDEALSEIADRLSTAH
ncbi:MAG: NAD-dependent epimerase/dehydratase family protein [Ornithinimicrobium sp.]